MDVQSLERREAVSSRGESQRVGGGGLSGGRVEGGGVSTTVEPDPELGHGPRAGGGAVPVGGRGRVGGGGGLGGGPVGGGANTPSWGPGWDVGHCPGGGRVGGAAQ